MNYFIEPPMLELNVPKFMIRRALVAAAKKMIQWAKSEYIFAVNYYRNIGDLRSASFIEKRLSDCSVLAKHPDFKRMCLSMDSDTFNSLNHQERRFLTDAWNCANRL